ncbi:MAG: hypothetical protein KDC98_25220 [Planctomycetes bacterium]|nr:hypothetical protein [Planctomycetota bacterium]
MASPLVDLQNLDLNRIVIPEEELRAALPHRDHFQLLDGICHYDPERNLAVGYKEWGEDAWWASGHIPGRPLMPGVLMIEGAAQVASFLIKKANVWASDRFIGLAGLNDVRMRGTVEPPARVYFVSGDIRISGRRLARMPAQVFCNGEMKMEMELLGVML